MRDQRQRRLGVIVNADGRREDGEGVRDPLSVCGEHRRERLPRPHDIAGSGGDDEAHGGVHDIRDLGAATAQLRDAAPDRPRLDLRHDTIAWRQIDLAFGRLREQPRIIDHAWVSPLRLDDLLKLAGGLPRRDGDLHASTGLVAISRGAPQQQHLRPERVGELHEVGRPLAAQGHDRLFDFNGVATGAAQRPIHGRHECHDRAAIVGAQGDHRLGQREPALQLRQEGPGAALHVEDEPRQPLGELLRHDARADERDALDGGRRIAQRVEAAIGGCDLVRLPDEGAPQPFDLRRGVSERQIGAKSGDRFELVERTTGMPETTPRHHWNRDPQRRDQRCEDQRHLVPDPTGGMLIDARQRQMGEIERRPAGKHRIGQCADFLAVQPLEENGHRECGHLVVRHVVRGILLHQPTPFGGGDLPPVALPFDQRACEHSLCIVLPTYHVRAPRARLVPRSVLLSMTPC